MTHYITLSNVVRIFVFAEFHLLKISGETKVMGMPDTPIGAYDMFAKTLLSSVTLASTRQV